LNKILDGYITQTEETSCPMHDLFHHAEQRTHNLKRK